MRYYHRRATAGAFLSFPGLIRMPSETILRAVFRDISWNIVERYDYTRFRDVSGGAFDEITLTDLWSLIIKKSSNGNIFRVTGPLWGESTGDRWVPLTKASNAELWCFISSLPEQMIEQKSRRRWFETPSRSLSRHCNDIVLWWFVTQRQITCHITDYCYIHPILISSRPIRKKRYAKYVKQAGSGLPRKLNAPVT